jgi:hypothetical protein
LFRLNELPERSRGRIRPRCGEGDEGVSGPVPRPRSTRLGQIGGHTLEHGHALI